MDGMQQMPIDLEQAVSMTCDECGSELFEIKYMIKKLSALVAPTGQDTLVPIQLFVCSNCNHINEEFLP
jgi:hypothetical protein